MPQAKTSDPRVITLPPEHEEQVADPPALCTQLAPALSCTLSLGKVVELEVELGIDMASQFLKLNSLLKERSTHLGRLVVAKFQMPEEQIDNFIQHCMGILIMDSKLYTPRFGYTTKMCSLENTLNITLCFPFLDNILQRMQNFEFLIDSQTNTPPVMSFSLNNSLNEEAMENLRMTFKSRDTAIARSVEIKAGQDVLHLFIVPPVLGVEL